MRASAEIVIERPMEAVWEWASDPAQLAPLGGGVARCASPASPGGRPLHRALERGGDTEELRDRRATPPRRQVVRARRPAGGPFEGTLELSEDVRGTRVRHTVDAGPEDALARFLFAVAGPLVRRSARRRIAAQLARLKDDGGAGGGALGREALDASSRRPARS